MSATAEKVRPLKPRALLVDPEEIPQELKDLPQFVAWQYQYNHERDEWGKVPVDPKAAINGPGRVRNASSTNPGTWGTSDQAFKAYEMHPPMVEDVPAPDDPNSTGNSGLDGIGICLKPDNGIVGVDLDHCLEDGRVVDPDAIHALELLAGTYVEMSPSRTGLRLFCRGRKPGTRSKDGDREMYDGRDASGKPGGRYLTLTGHSYGDPLPIIAKHEEINELYAQWFTKKEKAKPTSATSPNGATKSTQTSAPIDDEILLERMFASKHGADIKRLWDGDTSAYAKDAKDGKDRNDGESEGDIALIIRLLWWCNYDVARADRLYRRSGLYRPKWDDPRGKETYGQGTIAKALAFVGKGPGDGYNGDNDNGFRDDGATAAKMQDHEVDPERIAQEITDFPLEVYPERLVLFIKAAAAALPAPPDFLAVSMLATLGSAIGISREIKLKDSWREGGRFFVAIVADPGSKKSPALALATAPLKELQRAYSKKYREALEEYECKKQEYEKAKADKRGSGETPEPPGAEPELSQCLTTDATIEALMSLHVKNLRSLMLYQDELSGWVSGMGQYKGGKGNDLQKWLSIWSGAQVIVNRKGKQAEVLDDPFINVAGCIPPDILPTLETSEGSDGFIDRILFCYPRGVRPTFNPNDDIPRELTLEYQKVFNTLQSLEPNEVDGTPQPKTLEMTPEALKLFTAWANDHHEENNAPGFDRRLRGAWAKLEGYCARFALVLHLTAHAAGEESDEHISLTSISKAAALTDYFKSHARRVYGQLKGDPLDKMLRTVYEYIDRQPGRCCVPRDLTRASLPGCATTAGTKALLQKLTAAELGRFKAITHANGRKGEAYVLADK